MRPRHVAASCLLCQHNSPSRPLPAARANKRHAGLETFISACLYFSAHKGQCPEAHQDTGTRWASRGLSSTNPSMPHSSRFFPLSWEQLLLSLSLAVAVTTYVSGKRKSGYLTVPLSLCWLVAKPRQEPGAGQLQSLHSQCCDFGGKERK